MALKHVLCWDRKSFDFTSDYLQYDKSVRTFSRRKCEYIIQPFCRTQLFANDFFNRCVSCFNGLPESVVSSKTVAEFKRRLSLAPLRIRTDSVTAVTDCQKFSYFYPSLAK